MRCFWEAPLACKDGPWSLITLRKMSGKPLVCKRTLAIWWVGVELQASREVTGSNADECFLCRCSKRMQMSLCRAPLH